MKMSRLVAAGSAAALLLALTGCGDSDSDATSDSTPESSSTPLSVEEFIEQADQICLDADPAMEALQPAEDATLEEQDAAFRSLADLFLDQAEKIGELTPPDEIADDVASMLDSLIAGAEVIKEEGAGVMELDANPLADAGAKAQALGFKTCGS